MPTKRNRRARNQRVRVTDRAVELYKASDWLGLHHELRLRPWEVSPLDVGEGADSGLAGSAGATSWAAAQALRAELEAHAPANDITRGV